MTTPSNHSNPHAPKPGNNQPGNQQSVGSEGLDWHEVTAAVAERPLFEFGDWIDEQLASLESDLAAYVTLGSKNKNLRQGR